MFYKDSIEHYLHIELNVIKQINKLLKTKFESLDEYLQFTEILEKPRGAKPFSIDQEDNSGWSGKLFDANADFDALVHDFKKIGYNLLYDDLDYFEYLYHIDNFIDNETSAIALRMSARQHKKRSVPISLE